jgi:hypothetical protein
VLLLRGGSSRGRRELSGWQAIGPQARSAKGELWRETTKTGALADRLHFVISMMPASRFFQSSAEQNRRASLFGVSRE